jgi:hypothetical protein
MNVDYEIKFKIVKEILEEVEIEKSKLNFLKINKLKNIVENKHIHILLEQWIEKNKIIEECSISNEDKINLQIEKYLKDVFLQPEIFTNKFSYLISKEALKLFLNFKTNDFDEGINLYETENYQYDPLYNYSDSEEIETEWARENKP